MRLWSLHPELLDVKGLVALWREGLLAQKVLSGKTKGYKNHPQLNRFKDTPNPLGAIATYLRHVVDEAERRGYNFDRSKIVNRRFMGQLPVNSGQLDYEFQHLLVKLKTRAPERYEEISATAKVKLHPLFKKVRGGIEDWEIT